MTEHLTQPEFNRGVSLVAAVTARRRAVRSARCLLLFAAGSGNVEAGGEEEEEEKVEEEDGELGAWSQNTWLWVWMTAGIELWPVSVRTDKLALATGLEQENNTSPTIRYHTGSKGIGYKKKRKKMKCLCVKAGEGIYNTNISEVVKLNQPDKVQRPKLTTFGLFQAHKQLQTCSLQVETISWSSDTNTNFTINILCLFVFPPNQKLNLLEKTTIFRKIW